MKRIFSTLIAVAALDLVVPALLWASGEAAGNLVVVADTRRLSSGILRYIADLYNTNPWLFAVWAVVLTALYGFVLGFIMDFIMSRTGLDLKSRKILEH
ncbi:MAG: DVU0150 family protein [Thermodesulfobacteriota bacterium]